MPACLQAVSITTSLSISPFPVYAILGQLVNHLFVMIYLMYNFLSLRFIKRKMPQVKVYRIPYVKIKFIP